MSESRLGRYIQLLRQDGWEGMEGPAHDGVVWGVVKYRLPRRQMEVYLAHSDDTLTVQSPLAARPREDCRLAVWRYLLRVNNEIRGAKFTLDPGGKLYLSAEIMAAGSNYQAFRGTLTAFRAYYEHFHREIELLAADRKLADAWLSLAPPGDEEPVEDEVVKMIEETEAPRPGTAAGDRPGA